MVAVREVLSIVLIQRPALDIRFEAFRMRKLHCRQSNGSSATCLKQQSLKLVCQQI